ncbi:MAG: DUF4833 domain-containing protein [Deltaproteobacteria bacterium]|nr:DUF4833 domain-containing protein [Deltaproteobacteria bacterium]
MGTHRSNVSGRVLSAVDDLAPLLCALFVAAPAMLLVRASHARASEGRADVESVFHIAKSENRNQIHYGIRLDSACSPMGSSPVYAYWRDYEDGPNARSELLSREEPAYGIGAQHVRRSDAGSTIRLRMRAFATRVITIEVSRGPTGCVARAVTTIGGQRARLDRVWAEIGFYSIDHIVLQGRRVSDGARITERIEP